MSSVPGGWLPNSATIQNSAFASPDPSAMHPFDTSGAVLPQSGLDQPHLQQQQNGNISRTSSPGFQAPAYSVTPVVPLKRPRPRDNSIDLSPRPTPQGLPGSRSQTPLGQNAQQSQQQQQLAYQIFQNNSNQRQFNNYNAPHLQHVGSANASPSPVMQQDPQFNAQGNATNAPKRVATQSPSPFSPAPSQQGFMSQGSPPPPTLAPNTPQDMNGQGMPSQQSYSQAYSQGYQSPATTTASSPAPTMTPNMPHNQMQAQMVYAQIQRQQQQQQQQRQQQQQQQQQHQQQQHQQQQQQIRMMQQQQNQAAQMNQMGQGSPMGVNPAMQGQMRQGPSPPQQQQTQQQAQQAQQAQWTKTLQEFMMKRGTPIRTQPHACGKPLNLYSLWVYVMKNGGSMRIFKENRWQQIAMSIGFHPIDQYPTAAEELSHVWREILGPFEENWTRQQQRNAQYQLEMKRQQARTGMQAPTGQQMPPANGAIQSQQPIRQQGMTPGPMPGTPGRPPQNGFTPPPQGMRQATPQQIPPSTPTTLVMDGSPLQSHATVPGYPTNKPPAPVSESSFSLSSQIPTTPQDAVTEFKPRVRNLDTHGGINVHVMAQIGTELANYRPTVPTYAELGQIDIHALSMQLKSGLPAEIKVALDTLATVSVELRQSIALESCEDLLEAMIDVAEMQMEYLGDHAPEGSEMIAMLPYEEVMRLCLAEQDGLIEVAPFLSQEYDLERCCDRLLCITTIIRNFSFFESNHKQLAAPFVVRFLSSVVERLGTCPLFMRTHTNLLDFMKDIIIYLSNLSHMIILPSEDEALNFLHLVLAFAPQPLPYVPGHENLFFTSYKPAIHRYLPPAIDTLAKLLARDDPNRAFFRNIFLSETHTSPPYDLLIRAFGLAISTIPSDFNPRVITHIIEARQPILEHGLLVADILSQIVPGSESPTARQWLSSEDGFAQNLLRMVCLLSPVQPPQPPPQPVARGQKPPPLHDPNPFSRITHRGMSVLRRLAMKSGDADESNGGLPQAIFPKRESLLGALLTVHIDHMVVRELCSYAGLD